MTALTIPMLFKEPGFSANPRRVNSVPMPATEVGLSNFPEAWQAHPSGCDRSMAVGGAARSQLFHPFGSVTNKETILWLSDVH